MPKPEKTPAPMTDEVAVVVLLWLDEVKRPISRDLPLSFVACFQSFSRFSVEGWGFSRNLSSCGGCSCWALHASCRPFFVRGCRGGFELKLRLILPVSSGLSPKVEAAPFWEITCQVGTSPPAGDACLLLGCVSRSDASCESVDVVECLVWYVSCRVISLVIGRLLRNISSCGSRFLEVATVAVIITLRARGCGLLLPLLDISSREAALFSWLAYCCVCLHAFTVCCVSIRRWWTLLSCSQISCSLLPVSWLLPVWTISKQQLPVSRLLPVWTISCSLLPVLAGCLLVCARSYLVVDIARAIEVIELKTRVDTVDNAHVIKVEIDNTRAIDVYIDNAHEVLDNDEDESINGLLGKETHTTRDIKNFCLYLYCFAALLAK